MLYQFKNGNSATKAARNIHLVCGKGCVNKRAEDGLRNSEMEISSSARSFTHPFPQTK